MGDDTMVKGEHKPYISKGTWSSKDSGVVLGPPKFKKRRLGYLHRTGGEGGNALRRNDTINKTDENLLKANIVEEVQEPQQSHQEAGEGGNSTGGGEMLNGPDRSLWGSDIVEEIQEPQKLDRKGGKIGKSTGRDEILNDTDGNILEAYSVEQIQEPQQLHYKGGWGRHSTSRDEIINHNAGNSQEANIMEAVQEPQYSHHEGGEGRNSADRDEMINDGEGNPWEFNILTKVQEPQQTYHRRKEGGSIVDRDEIIFNTDGNSSGANIIEEVQGGLQKLIVGGYGMNGGQRNFCMSLNRDDEKYYRGECGGTLIADQWIITAGHCISQFSKNDLRDKFDSCYMNAYKPWSKNNGGKPYEVIPIDYCMEHPLHKPGPTPYDFAVCKLEFPAHHSLPRAPIADNSLVKELSDGTSLRTVGMGEVYFKGHQATHIQEVHVPLVNNKDCSLAMGKYGEIDDTVLCAGGEGGKDACKGDSGGPIFNNQTLVGITSWGHNCGVEGLPGIYGNVGAVISWIESFEMEGLIIKYSNNNSNEVSTGLALHAKKATADRQNSQSSCNDTVGKIPVYTSNNNVLQDMYCSEVVSTKRCGNLISPQSYIKAKDFCKRSCNACV